MFKVQLHKLIQQPVNLSMRQGDEIVYVERAYSPELARDRLFFRFPEALRLLG